MQFAKKSIGLLKRGDIVRWPKITMDPIHEHNYNIFKKGEFGKYDLSCKYEIWTANNTSGIIKGSQIMELVPEHMKFKYSKTLTPKLFTDLFEEYDKYNVKGYKLFTIKEKNTKYVADYGSEPESVIAYELHGNESGEILELSSNSIYNMYYKHLNADIHDHGEEMISYFGFSFGFLSEIDTMDN